LTDLDTADGKRIWSTGWLLKDNASGITREDVSAGMAKLAPNYIQSILDALMK